MKNNDNPFKYLASILIGLSLIIMFWPACTYSKLSGVASTGDYIYLKEEIGSIYDFIFGSDRVENFNFPLFLGFLAIVFALIHWLYILVTSYDDLNDLEACNMFIKLYNGQTVLSGIAMFFLSPIFTSMAVDNFRKSWPADKPIDYDFSCIVLFLFLLGIFIYNIIMNFKFRSEKRIIK